MSFNYSSDNLEDIHHVLMETLHSDFDFESTPRGKPIRELVAANFTLTNPRNRLILSPTRNVNYGFGVGELCWYIRGDTDLATMLYYNKRMSQFSDDGVTINSAYGARIFNTRFRENKSCGDGHDAWDRSQFDNVIEELRRDPHSRRAVMHINEPNDLDKATVKGSKDVPCTMSMQLLIRDRRLHMHVLMRSNDVVWGMPYDVFSFTCLQEALLYRLQEQGVPVDDLGSYHHTAGSLHIYDTHFDMAKEVSGEIMLGVSPMAPFTMDTLQKLAHEDEASIRNDDWADLIGCPKYAHDEDSIGWMFQELVKHKNKRINEALVKKESNEQK